MAAAPSLGDQIRRLFPDGTGNLSAEKPARRTWDKLPWLPVDVFAAAAHLLEASGAYQFIVAPFVGIAPPPDVRYAGSSTRSATKQDVDRWRAIGRRWAKDWRVGQREIQPIWDELWLSRRSRFVVRLTEFDEPPSWWYAAHALLIIADECSSDLGYTLSNASLETASKGLFWANALAYSFAQSANRPDDLIVSSDDPTDDRHIRKHITVDTLDYVVDPNVARVLPKGRTPEFGCSMRTMSHNLTLLPPRGFTSAYWHQPVADQKNQDTKLNLLLLPFPFVIPPKSFRGRENKNKKHGRWGRFRIDQRWLRPDGKSPAAGTEWSTPEGSKSFVEFVDRLLAEAKRNGKCINGLILPEYALDWTTYDKLVRHVRDRWKDVELVISGVSRDCNKSEGNFVVVSTIYRDGMGNRVAATHSRRKHHRWQLDGAQIRGYGLEKDLSPKAVWWEYLEIGHRMVHMDIFRNRSALTAVICEDLARVDPALSLIRSIGPNLVFALLMDGPQLAKRWPGTYATSLSDDPGSSVMTITSAALVDRSNITFARNGGKGQRSIALWRHHVRMPGGKSSDNDTVAIELDKNAQAVVLQLNSKPAPETTIDGRSNSDTTAWYYVGYSQVKIPASEVRKKGWEWILSGPVA
ncbi:hypothetical protein ACYCVF_31175 [Bradyrhizobium sp. 1.29L]